MFSLAINFIYRVIVFGLSRDKSLKTFEKLGDYNQIPRFTDGNPLYTDGLLCTRGKKALTFTLKSPRVNTTDTDLISMAPLL